MKTDSPKFIILIGILLLSTPSLFGQVHVNIRKENGKFGVRYAIPIKKELDYMNNYLDPPVPKYDFTYRWEWGVPPVYDTMYKLSGPDFNGPIITRKGDKYGFILIYEVGVLDDYHDSLVEYPPIYDTVYYPGDNGAVVFKKDGKWGYARGDMSWTVGYRNYDFSMDGKFTEHFLGNFYVSPIVYDKPLYYYENSEHLLVKDGKYGFFGKLGSIIPCEYDTLIYENEEGKIETYKNFALWFSRWQGSDYVDGWYSHSWSKESEVMFIKAVKGAKYTIIMASEKTN